MKQSTSAGLSVLALFISILNLGLVLIALSSHSYNEEPSVPIITNATGDNNNNESEEKEVQTVVLDPNVTKINLQELIGNLSDYICVTNSNGDTLCSQQSK